MPPFKLIVCPVIYEDFFEHKKETGRPDVDNPTIFTRFADSQVAHMQPLIKPDNSDRFDYEAEMAIIIGKGGRFISEDEALSHIAGYACYNDGSIRNYQRHTSQYTPGKTFPGTGGFGVGLGAQQERNREIGVSKRKSESFRPDMDSSLNDIYK